MFVLLGRVYGIHNSFCLDRSIFARQGLTNHSAPLQTLADYAKELRRIEEEEKYVFFILKSSLIHFVLIEVQVQN